jgi:hypothetical protein
MLQEEVFAVLFMNELKNLNSKEGTQVKAEVCSTNAST